MKKTNNIFCRALNVPPSQTRSELGNVIGLCEHLNDFLTTVEIEVCMSVYNNVVFGFKFWSCTMSSTLATIFH